MPDLSPASFAASIIQYRRRRSLQGVLAALLLGAVAPGYTQVALDTSFSYQGQLTESGQPANGLYDLQVCLFDTPSNPLPLACMPDFADIPVERGVFAIALDFGASPFTGQQRFLELRVRPGASSSGYTILAPRQLVRATPEALRANTAPWSGLTGVPAGFADGVDNNSGGTVTGVTAGTGLSGGTISGSGTIGIAPGGVGSVQIADGSVAAVDIAPGAVGSGQLAPGAVGLAQINPAQVQARITGICAVGAYLRGINIDGSLVCELLPGVTNTISVVDWAGSVGAHGSVAVGADGLPVISYFDASASALKVAKCSNPACTGTATITTVDDPADTVAGLYTSIAIGGDGLPVISYYDALAGDLKVAKCANSACTGAATLTVVDAIDGQYPAMAIGIDGLPVISYFNSSPADLKVAKCANAACTSIATVTVVDETANSVGVYSDIAIGADGRPVISYHDATAGALKVAKCANAACTGAATITTVDDPPINIVADSQTSIAIGRDALPIISYIDRTAGALKVAKCANAACSGTSTITTVSGNAILFTSIAIGSDGLPVISYSGQSQRVALKVAQCVNEACTGASKITAVDSPPDSNVGFYSSIAIGNDGMPVISYWNDSLEDLKVAKCVTRSCQ